MKQKMITPQSTKGLIARIEIVTLFSFARLPGNDLVTTPYVIISALDLDVFLPKMDKLPTGDRTNGRGL